MTDKELLELAAKAACIEKERVGNETKKVWLAKEQLWVRGWNPLTDDGDALRLAVAIAGNGWCFADLDAAYSMRNTPCWLDANNPHAATRRAIVRAAAEIGLNLNRDE